MDPTEISMDKQQDGEYFTSYEDLEVCTVFPLHLFIFYGLQNSTVFVLLFTGPSVDVM